MARMSSLLLLLLPVLLAAQGPPIPPQEAFTCPYPPASSIQPCECLTENLTDPTKFKIYLYCRWTMGQDNEADAAQFQAVMDKFNSYKEIYVMQMTCDNCWDFELDGFFHENTTGKFEIEYLDVEHFDSTTLATEDMVQFSSTAFQGSRDSLVYARLYPFHYFSPSSQLFSGMTALQQLLLHNLDTGIGGFPHWGSIPNLRFLSLLDGNFGSISPGSFSGLDLLNSLFLDRCQVSTLEAGDFADLPSLTHLSLTYNNISLVPAGTFTNTSSLLLLNMGNSNIEEVEDSFEGSNSNIQILLQNNNIRTLPEATWRPLTEKIMNTPLSMGQVDLNNNPLDCGCDVKWLIVDLKAPTVFTNARCANGENLLEMDPAVLEFFCPE